MESQENAHCPTHFHSYKEGIKDMVEDLVLKSYSCLQPMSWVGWKKFKTDFGQNTTEILAEICCDLTMHDI